MRVLRDFICGGNLRGGRVREEEAGGGRGFSGDSKESRFASGGVMSVEMGGNVMFCAV
jgi:hypothetical protein